MKIITKTLTRSDLFDIIFKLDNVTLDLTLLNEFTKDNSPLVNVQDLQAELEKLPIQIHTQENIDYFDAQVYFTRAYHLFLLLIVLKNKSQIRLQVAEFLVLMLNSKIKCSNYFPKPYSILYSFYGENAVSALLDTPSKLPSLTTREKEILVPYLENTYYFALSAVNLFKVQSLVSLSEVSFSFFLEQNAIKGDFLQIKYEKRGNNKFVSPTANNVVNLVAGSKFSKVVPKNIITTWVDLIAQVKAVVQESLNSILEEVNTEENENLKDLNIKDENYNSKNALFFNTQSLNLVTSVIAVIHNGFERFKENKEVTKEVSAAIDQLFLQFSQKRAAFFALLSTPVAEIGFGSEFGPMIHAVEFTRIFYESIVVETLNAYVSLDTLNKTLNEKAAGAKGGKPAEESKEESAKVQKASRKIQLGKGDNALFSLFEDYVAANSAEIAAFREYFAPFNFELQSVIEDLISPKNNERRKPKIPKGTRDMDPNQMTIRRMAINTISNIFRKHGAVEIDTPVFELRETLTGKYGENSKLIYDLQDQGGEQLSLRYDLTVPFARYLATNSRGVTNMKRLQIAKVYRRDQPQPKKGRFREFYQCDYDVVGSYGVMIPDAECIMIMDEIFTTLSIGKVVIKINHRRLLDAMVELSGAPRQKFKHICSSIDKLDKETWEDVRTELITEKGLTAEMADKLGIFVQYKGKPLELYERLVSENVFTGSKEGEAALKEMGILFKYLTEVKCTENVLFDLSLARGLDYYTGIIYEAVLDDPSSGMGSIAGGGRYDELVGMFSNKDLPAVGLSIGIERIFGLLERKYENSTTIRACETEVLVGSIGSGLATERFKLIKLLWDNEVKAEMLYNDNPKPQKQLQYALENYIPFVLWIGEEELKNNKVKVKCLYKKEEQEVDRDQLVAKLRELLFTYNTDKMNGKVEFEKPEEDKDEEKGGRGRRGEKGAAKEPKEPKEKKEPRGKKESKETKEAPKEAAKEEKIEPATENK
jgi:histidyl-tRNA synthetase